VLEIALLSFLLRPLALLLLFFIRTLHIALLFFSFGHSLVLHMSYSLLLALLLLPFFLPPALQSLLFAPRNAPFPGNGQQLVGDNDLWKGDKEGGREGGREGGEERCVRNSRMEMCVS